MRTNDSISALLKKGHIAITVAVCLFMSCTTDTVYHHFERTAEGGWDKRDTFFFKIDTVISAGRYATTLCIRTDADYPYRNLSVRTVQVVKPGNGVSTHTLNLNIRQESGIPAGDGITLYNYEVPVGTLTLRPGDSLTVKVAHNMRRETMPGVTDVGLKVTKQ
ncbi:MAG: gliding motility lipoprotein GldH [Prevotella sp.]|nr:gliding motility lipoprotein GldH [Prevotella sp.]